MNSNKTTIIAMIGDKKMDMNNNDILIRLRYALDIKNAEMVQIFKLGGIEVTREEVQKILTKIQEDSEEASEPNEERNSDSIVCDNFTLESFLNGFIIYKRGKQEPRPAKQNAHQ